MTKPDLTHTLTWDPMTTDFECQEEVMTDFSNSIINDATMRGQFYNLIFNLLASLAHDLADITDNNNFQNIWTCVCAPIDHKNFGLMVDGFPRACKMNHCPNYAEECTNLP